MTALSRRRLLWGVAAGLVGCRRGGAGDAPAPVPDAGAPGVAASSAPLALARPAARVRVHDLAFAQSSLGATAASVLELRGSSVEPRLPVLVALHGRGESRRGVEVGAHAWQRDYALDRAALRLAEPPLVEADFGGFVEPARLAALNASLAARPYRGLLVACPWVPDVLDDRRRADLDASLPFGAFVVDELLPRVVAELAASGERAATGIDGVSLGGRVALVVGLAHPERFGAVGSLQAALQDAEAPALARRAVEVMRRALLPRLRLVTSERDFFRGAIARLDAALTAARVPHEHLLVPGPHDYAWNRGPGAIEMLLWHDRVLRGEAPL